MMVGITCRDCPPPTGVGVANERVLDPSEVDEFCAFFEGFEGCDEPFAGTGSG